MDSTPIIDAKPISPPTPPPRVPVLPETFIVCYPIWNDKGNRTLSVQMSFDVTPWRSAESALSEAKKMAEKLTGAVILHYVPEAK